MDRKCSDDPVHLHRFAIILQSSDYRRLKKHPGPSCSKLTMSLVNVSLNF